MDFVHHRTCNDKLSRGGNPAELVDERPLPIERDVREIEGGLLVPVIRHFWKPSPEELAALNANGVVFVESFGRTIAPVYVGVIEQ